MNVPLSRGFKNRYLDPNHPATNGGISGLLSGGYLTQSPDTRKRNSLRQIDDEERRVQEEYQRQIDSIYRQNRSPFEVDRQLRQREEEYWRRLDDMQRRREQVEERERHIKNVGLFWIGLYCC